MAVSKNAQYLRVHRERLGEAGRLQQAKVVAVKRIMAGRIPHAGTLKKFDISNAEVNRIRATVGLPPVDLSTRPTHCKRGPGSCVLVSGDRIQLPEHLEQVEQIEQAEQAFEEVEQQAPAGFTLAEVLEKLKALEGKASLNKDGRPGKNKKGQARFLSDKTVKQMLTNMRMVGRVTGCGEREDFTTCLRNHQQAIRKLKEKYPNIKSYKNVIGVLTSAAKYIPGFKEAVGDEAWQAFRVSMLQAIKEAEAQAIAQTDTAKVTPIEVIRAKIPAIATKFGETSLEHIAARLQAVELIGIRDDLTDLKFVKSKKEADQQGVHNYIVLSTRKVVIARYKTWQSFDEPYKFTLSKETANLIKDSLRQEKPRDSLFGRKRAGQIVQDAFEAVGLEKIGVNTLRHSLITNLLKPENGGPGAANVNRIAKRFRHSGQLTLRYVAGEAMPIGDV